MKIKTKFIAEIGSNHNRNLSRCYKLIDEAKKLGFYAVKFQLFKINKLYSKNARSLKWLERSLMILHLVI